MTDDRLPDDWEPEQNRVYHEVYALALTNQCYFKHPGAELATDAHWQTICHNFAFMAATASGGDSLTIVSEDGDLLMTNETGMQQ
jgi:hypothetical protein